jgi:phosphoglycerate dehydrogenase-like enzyme
MRPVTVWVLAKASDKGLRLLDPPPAGVTFVFGDTPEAFQDAPAPEVLLIGGFGRALLEPVFKTTPSVAWVHSRFAGLEGLLFPELVESEVPLTNARGAFSRSLAEFVVAGLLYFAKDFGRMKRNQAARAWEVFDVEELHGRTLGIVGYGDIGRAIAERARPFGMRILAVRQRPERSRDDPSVDEVWPLERLEELMGASDDVAVALPATPATSKLVSARALHALKPTAVFANVGRGAVVDERALVRALEERRIKGAVLDVYETEPLPDDHPLWRLDNVILSPHTADHTAVWLDDATRIFLANLERYRRGEPLENVVDKRAGY